MIDTMREKQKEFTILSNQIDYQLQQFEIKLTIEEKRNIFYDLKNLFSKLEENVINFF